MSTEDYKLIEDNVKLTLNRNEVQFVLYLISQLVQNSGPYGEVSESDMIAIGTCSKEKELIKKMMGFEDSMSEAYIVLTSRFLKGRVINEDGSRRWRQK